MATYIKKVTGIAKVPGVAKAIELEEVTRISKVTGVAMATDIKKVTRIAKVTGVAMATEIKEVLGIAKDTGVTGTTEIGGGPQALISWLWSNDSKSRPAASLPHNNPSCFIEWRMDDPVSVHQLRFIAAHA